MNSIDFLEKKFKSAFSEDQSKVLADVIIHSYENLVKIPDFNEFKQITLNIESAQTKAELKMGELAEAQIRTEHRVEELAEAQIRTEHRVEELAEAQKRTEERVEELAEAQIRTEHRVEELAEAQKRTEESVAKLSSSVEILSQKVEDLAVAQKSTEISLQNLSRQVGGLSEAFGGSLEDFAKDLVPEILENNWDMKIDSCESLEIQDQSKILEFDLVIEGTIGGKLITVLVEVKSNLTLEETKKFFLKVDIAKNYFSGEIRVLFFGYRVKREALEFIKDMGGYAISTRGKIL